jgi:hypothetical protein
MLHRRYTPDEIDAIAAYSAELQRCFYIPIEDVEGRSDIQLRLRPARNNQRNGITWADDFSLEARLTGLLGP